MGTDAPTTARVVGLPPRRGQYFLSKRKKVPKKARGTATTGKRLLLPILTAGLAMSRAMELDSYHLRLERARARLFPLSKWASLFPSAAYRRSAPPQVAWGKLKWRCLGCSSVAGRLRSAEKQDYFFSVVSIRQTYKRRLGYFGASWIFSQRKRPAWFPIHAGLLREP